MKISVPKPQIWQNFRPKASYWPEYWLKIQFFKPLFFPQNQFSVQPLFFVPGRSLTPGFFNSPFAVKVGGGALVFEVGYHPR